MLIVFAAVGFITIKAADADAMEIIGLRWSSWNRRPADAALRPDRSILCRSFDKQGHYLASCFNGLHCSFFNPE